MGRVKDHFHDEICARAARDAGEYEPSPEDLEEMARAFHELEAERMKEGNNVKPVR